MLIVTASSSTAHGTAHPLQLQSLRGSVIAVIRHTMLSVSGLCRDYGDFTDIRRKGKRLGMVSGSLHLDGPIEAVVLIAEDNERGIDDLVIRLVPIHRPFREHIVRDAIVTSNDGISPLHSE
jgi:hypothetical protein